MKTFSERHGRMVTLEFILIDGVNDSLDQAGKLREIARDLHAHVNLIPYNTVEGLLLAAAEPPTRPARRSSPTWSGCSGASVTLRREKGHDIDAACGQLRLKTEQGMQAS